MGLLCPQVGEGGMEHREKGTQVQDIGRMGHGMGCRRTRTWDGHRWDGMQEGWDGTGVGMQEVGHKKDATWNGL